MENKVIHRLSDVDPIKKIGICSVCGPVKVRFKKKGRVCWNRMTEGKKRYRKTEGYKASRRKHRKRYPRKHVEPYRKYVRMVCEACGFKAIHPCQMDGHHRDGNRKNNDESNIASLCAICHRVEHLPESVKESLGRREPVLELPKPILIESFEDEKLKVEVALLRKKVKEYEVMLNGS